MHDPMQDRKYVEFYFKRLGGDFQIFAFVFNLGGLVLNYPGIFASLQSEYVQFENETAFPSSEKFGLCILLIKTPLFLELKVALGYS